MADIHRIDRLPDSEKITLNLGYVDLGQIDLLVSERLYANRTDFIRTAIRNPLSTHAEAMRQVVVRKAFVLGVQQFSRADLDAIQAADERLQIRVGAGVARQGLPCVLQICTCPEVKRGCGALSASTWT